MKPRTVHKCWPNAGLSAPLTTDLPLPTHFEKTIELIEPSKITEDVILGPEPQRHIDAINKFVDAGFDHVYVHHHRPQAGTVLSVLYGETAAKIQYYIEIIEWLGATRSQPRSRARVVSTQRQVRIASGMRRHS
jgi:hypothetical protein